MRILKFVLPILMILSLIILSSADAAKIDKEDEKLRQAKSAFEEIIDLWYEQKFDELYTKFAYKKGGKITKEKFTMRMRKEKKRLACCWQKIQDVKIKLSSSNQALISAKLGFEDQSQKVVYITTEIPLYLKDELWRIKIQDILSTAPDLPE